MKSSLLNLLVLGAFTAVFSMTMVTVGSAGISGANQALSIDDDPNEPQPEHAFGILIDEDPNDPNEPQPECTFDAVIDGDPNDPDPEPQPETA